MVVSRALLLTFVCSLTAWHDGGIGWATVAGNPDNGPGDVYRLPGSTEPVSYELRIMPAVEGDLSFRGQVDIVVKTKQYTSELILNSKDLIVSYVSPLKDLKTNRSTAVKDYAHDDASQRLVVSLEKTILPSRLYKLSVEFSGTLRTDYTGFHKYFYDSDDNTRWVALTQFKPIYARRAFPCYDEPKFKTPYKISIFRQSQHSALSNMPLKNSEVDPASGWVWDHFETTKPIPTYLVAFMVSDFDKTSMNGEYIAMHTRKEYIENTTYMMGKAPNLLNGVEQFTRMPYMLPKLDLVGVPFLDSYTNENWGLNSYEEFYVTLTEDSQTEDKIQGTMTILHEILHQWFGNMVTTPWWDNAWLNEGMCNFLNYYITSKIEPEWDLTESFVEKVHQYALSWDGYEDTHPLTFAVSTPDEIVNVFDTITTDKSTALFRMLESVVGENVFRASLNKYLDDFGYKKAGPIELWEMFDYVLYDTDCEIGDGITVNEYMKLWTQQPGYPLITVTSASDNGSYVVSQKRFSLSHSRKTTNDEKWLIGLTYTTEAQMDFDELSPDIWLKPDDELTPLTVPADSGWIIVNMQSSGFYRVNYDEKNWKLLLIQLATNPDRIHVLNRAQIIDDVYHLCRASLVPYDYYISLLEYLLMEDHVMPWNTAVTGLSSIADAIRQYPAEHLKFKGYVKGLADILFVKLSENRMLNETTKIGWSKLFTWTCNMGSSRCTKLASGLFGAWLSGYEISSEMEEAAMCAGMKRVRIVGWSRILKLYKKTRSPSQKKSIQRALACAENVHIMLSHLDLVRLDGTIRVSLRNFKTICENIVTTPTGVKAIASFLLRQLDTVQSSTTGVDLHKYVVIAYSALASKVATSDEITVMDEIRRSVKSADLRAVLDKIHQNIESKFMWMEQDHTKIMKAIGEKR